MNIVQKCFVSCSAIKMSRSYEIPFWDSEKKKRAQQETEQKAITKMGHVFEDIPEDERNKESFNRAIGLFCERNVHRRNQVEFIYAALKRLKQFGVHKDIETYKNLLNIFPKGKMVSTSVWQWDFGYYPKHQDCAIDVLDEMEYNRVYPDKEIYDIVKNTFGGGYTHAMRKMARMMFWMPKFKYLNPYPVPQKLPQNQIELARLVMARICRDPATKIFSWMSDQIEHAMDKTWIVCGQSLEQQEHIKKHPIKKPLYIDGPYRAWFGSSKLKYFSLTADPDPNKVWSDFIDSSEISAKEWENLSSIYTSECGAERKKAIITQPTMHEQQEGTILALAITGTSSKASLVHWFQFLCAENANLNNLSVVYRIKHSPSTIIVRDWSDLENRQKQLIKT